MTPSVQKRVVLRAPPERAFRVFTAGIDRWWPRQHHIGASPMKQILVEPGVGGRWYTVCEDGSECDIGRVLAWDPPSRLVLAWQITGAWQFDPAFVTEVEVRFTPDGATTVVELEHRDLDRYADVVEAIRGQLDSPEGWLGSLEQFARVAPFKAVVVYHTDPAALPKAQALFPAHAQRLGEFSGRGELLAVGTWADPREGAMAIFRDREAAQSFVAGDPFVLESVVSKYEIRDWAETLLPG